MNRSVLCSVLLIALVLFTLLAGCAQPSAPAQPAAPTTAPAAAPTEAPAAQATSPTQAPRTVAPTEAPLAPTAEPTAAATAAPTAAPAAAGAAAPTKAALPPSPDLLRLATTTSTADTGLLDYLLPDFEKANNVKVDVVAVGTGQAIAIGQKCDADVLLVHARAQEDKFVKDGYAPQRYDVMYNDFVIVGPKDDPAKTGSAKDAAAAFKAIADSGSTFVSRGDKSGTNTKELAVWSSAKITPTKEMKWYNAIGQGMGDTLVFANEQQGYTLSDRGTWLAQQSKLPDLKIVFGGEKLADNKDKTLLNPYGVLPVGTTKCPSVNSALAEKFATWITSADTQQKIAAYGVDKFGQPLFYANAKK